MKTAKGQERRLYKLFCAVLCATIVHKDMHTHMVCSYMWLLLFSFPYSKTQLSRV